MKVNLSKFEKIKSDAGLHRFFSEEQVRRKMEPLLDDRHPQYEPGDVLFLMKMACVLKTLDLSYIFPGQDVKPDGKHLDYEQTKAIFCDDIPDEFVRSMIGLIKKPTFSEFLSENISNKDLLNRYFKVVEIKDETPYSYDDLLQVIEYGVGNLIIGHESTNRVRFCSDMLDKGYLEGSLYANWYIEAIGFDRGVDFYNLIALKVRDYPDSEKKYVGRAYLRNLSLVIEQCSFDDRTDFIITDDSLDDGELDCDELDAEGYFDLNDPDESFDSFAERLNPFIKG